MSRGFTKGAAILCGNSSFRDFLAQKTGRPVPDAEAAAKEVRLAVRVMSRRELDANPAAAERYGHLVAEFNAWRR
ncbi:hypothetical protein NFH98_20865 [Halomonas sp. H33-56]|uniref:hypothetical protein n=1 Tax=Halomonas sp. H33-56 TaxID=2950873 RepID=UPI0032DF0339